MNQNERESKDSFLRDFLHDVEGHFQEENVSSLPNSGPKNKEYQEIFRSTWQIVFTKMATKYLLFYKFIYRMILPFSHHQMKSASFLFEDVLVL
jgi:hypothetical protein